MVRLFIEAEGGIDNSRWISNRRMKPSKIARRDHGRKRIARCKAAKSKR